MSWFWRGFQSAIFYYVSCAPCSKLSYRRKRRKEYKRAKAEKAMNEAEQGLYEHPSPFSTNPYWQEEIAVGPGPPVRKAQRDGKGKPETGKQKKDRQSKTSGSGHSHGTGTGSADTLTGDEGQSTRDSREGWNKKRHQREDEVLWGLELQETNSSGAASPSSRSASGSFYQYCARNPEINDLHPPVVSTQPRTKTETLWMLQPPPRAKVMEGKERASLENTPTRSRSTSGGSNWGKSTTKKASDISLGRQIGERLVGAKLKQGNLPSAAEPATTMSRGSSARSNKSTTSSTIAQGQPHDRDTVEVPMPAVIRTISSKRANPPPPISISAVEESLPSPLPERPPLSTIPSERLSKSPTSRPALVTAKSANSVSSLRVLQELVTPSAQLNTLLVARTPTLLPSPLANRAETGDGAMDVSLPPPNKQEDEDLQLDFPPVPKENRMAPPALGHRWSMSI
ncbi:hypothetical protein ACLMJK_004230 [Lecanora helva]